MNLAGTMRKLFGDRRDQTAALREAGFDDEAAASRWASSLAPEPAQATNEVKLTKLIRQARPDLSLKTATYIARQTKTRHS